MGFSKVQSTLFFLIIWKLGSVFVIQTSHVPDEYWQSLEVAHKIAFGYGHLTWEWREHMRSYMYPFLISLLYRLLRSVCLDHASILIILPRVFQAILSAYSDYRFYIWTKNKWALFCLSVNWYWYYCSTRTLINSVETSLTTLALSIFPWRDGENKSSLFLWIVGFLCMARPTSGLVWLPLCLYHFFTSSLTKFTLASNYFLIGMTCLLISSFVDTFCYGEFVLTPWEFLRVNVLNKVSESYGIEHSLWYFTSGLPVLLGLNYLTLFPAIIHVCKHWKIFYRQAILLCTVAWTIGIYSYLSHKEFRFLLPLLPMLIYINCSSDVPVKKFSVFKRKFFIALLVITNLVPGIYFSLIHQKGALNAMNIIRRDLNSTDTGILFLTPCHATPLYSHLHKNVTVRFLLCEPNLKRDPDYIEEAQMFFAQPMLWLNHTFGENNTSLYNYLVVYDNFERHIAPFLKNYEEFARVFDSHFQQPNYGNYLVVYKRKRPG